MSGEVTDGKRKGNKKYSSEIDLYHFRDYVMGEKRKGFPSWERERLYMLSLLLNSVHI